MRKLLALSAVARRSFRGSLTARLAVVVAVASAAGATAGLLPAIVGVAMNAILGRSTPPAPGSLGALARAVADAPAWVVVLATFAATVASVLASVASSKLGSELAGEVTASLRIEMLRAALLASPRAVEEAGRALS